MPKIFEKLSCKQLTVFEGKYQCGFRNVSVHNIPWWQCWRNGNVRLMIRKYLEHLKCPTLQDRLTMFVIWHIHIS